MPINNFLLPGAKVTTGYEVANSCRFNDGDSAYMTRANAGSDGTTDTWTMSMWVKRSTLGTNQFLFIGNTSGNFNVSLRFNTSDQLYFYQEDHPAANGKLIMTTERVFRDTSAWYHIVAQYDSTQSTNTNRAKIYINGVQETTFASTVTWPDQNFDSEMTSASTTIYIGRESGDSMYFDGYMAEVVLLDGTAATPTSFGEFDEDSPQIFKPKDVSGLTFGTHGFYLDFEDSSNLGNDANGGTDFTENNLAATDQATDTPTNNFCVMNFVDNYYQSATFSEGNCEIVTAASSNTASTLGTFGVNKSKWYWEAKFVSDSQGSSYGVIGIEGAQVTSATDALLEGTQSYGLYLNDGKIWTNNGSNNHGAHIDVNAIIGVALDLDNNRIYFSKDGNWGDGSGNWDEASPNNYLSVTAAASVALGNYFPAHGDWSSGTIGWEVNFGGCPAFTVSSGNADANGYGNFEYAVPSGFYSLCSKNLAEFG